MIKNLLVLCLTTLLLSSCAKSIYYGPEAGNWQQLTPPDSSDIAYTVYLLGDAGAPSSNPTEPNLKLLKLQLDQDDNSTLIVLGDNLYHDGLSAEGTANRDRDVQRLDEQVKVALDHKGKVFFIPGNHDWDFMGPRGLEKVRRQEAYIEQRLNKGNTFVPDNGCPGPYTEQLSDEVVFIGFDSHWWLHRHEKPYGPYSGCGAANETEMLEQIEQILEENRGKHIVISSHHPFVSNSNHGGYYSVTDHLFPLRLIRDGLFIPLPVIGSLYPFYRKFGGVDQDIPHYRYQLLIQQMQNIFSRYDNIIYTAGHDHNLQLHRIEKFTHIISGSGCKTTPVAAENNATFAHAEKGFVKLLYYRNGEAWAEFWSPTGDGSKGKVNYRSKLYDQLRPNAGAQVACTDPIPAASAEVAVANPKNRPYALAGIFLRDDYSQEWQTAVQVPFLNLADTGQGLTPVGLGNEVDKNSLRLRSSSGFEYRFRPLLRSALRAVPQQYRSSTAIQDVAETWLPSQHPYAPLISAPLERAAGLVSATPTLYLMPDVACLEPYREQFKGKLGFLEPDAEDLHAQKTGSDGKGVQAASYTALLHLLEGDNLHQADARAFAKARLLDMLLGDWDRHEGQYEWTATKQGDKVLYSPISKGRDNAFFAFNGFFPWLVSRGWGFREMQHFGRKISHLKSLNYTARNLDRRLTGSLSKRDWQLLSDSLVQSLTDEVLAKAVAQMPPEVYALHGEGILQKLKARRSQLPEAASQYAGLLAKYVDLYGSKKREVFEIGRHPNGNTTIRIFGMDNLRSPLVSRTFYPSETKEIRLYGFGGGDTFRVTGEKGGDIVVRIIGYKEQGRYQHAYSDSLAQGLVQEYRFLNGIADKKVVDNTKPTYEDFASLDLLNSPASDEFEYTRFEPSATVLYNSSDGLVLGAGMEYKPYKFRTSRFGGYHRLLYQRAFKTGAARVFYEGEIKNLAFDLDFVGRGWAYAPYYSMNYTGYGNRPAPAPEGTDPRLDLNHIHLAAALQKPFGTFFAIGAGPVYDFFRLSNPSNSLPEQDQDAYGRRSYAGANVFFKTSVMDNPHNPTRGLVVNLDGNWFQGLANTNGRYSRYNYEVRYYMSPLLPFQLTFAGRIGGGINTGRYAFYQGSMIGGGLLPDFTQTIRGYSQTRFIGDKSLYANLELRTSVLNYRIYLFPGKIGLLALYDSGRVWSDLNNQNGWNSAYGGGAWISVFNRIALSATVAKSREGTFFNIQNGFYF